MRYVKELLLYNWGPFKGTHILELEPTVYAVVAEHADDAERSNWIGKTWFLNAMLFALTGIKPESCKSEDGWITNGETEGSVQLICDDGTAIIRSRKQGRSTQLVVNIAGGKNQKQTAAQDSLFRAMGLDGTDLLASCFVRQKQIARLILADPAERTDIVNAWVELEDLQNAEQWLRDRLNALLKEERELAASMGEDYANEANCNQGLLLEAETDLTGMQAERAKLVDQIKNITDWQQHERNANEFVEVRDRGRAIRAQVDAFESSDLDALSCVADAARAAQGVAGERVTQVGELVHGEWDGDCPITCEECPARDRVEKLGTIMDHRHEHAVAELQKVARAANVAKVEYQDARAAAHKQSDRETELVRLRELAMKLAPSLEVIEDKGRAPDLEDLGGQLGRLNEDISVIEREVVERQAKDREHARYAQAAQDAADERAELDGAIRTHREAIAVVGRQGAQREVAEGALGRIEHGANNLLRTAGIDLTVEVRWAREGRGLASHCESCGTAFPKSLKVKACDVCGSQRGPKLVEKLDIKPSDRSGAADDIAGLSFQLAASSWLRAKRTASWSSTCIDEPFGALDAANSRALSTHLHALIRGSYAFDQGFLVAHDAATMEALPSRILIKGSGDGATVEVQ